METEKGRRIMTIIFVIAFVCFVLAVMVGAVIRGQHPTGAPDQERPTKVAPDSGIQRPGVGERDDGKARGPEEVDGQ